MSLSVLNVQLLSNDCKHLAQVQCLSIKWSFSEQLAGKWPCALVNFQPQSLPYVCLDFIQLLKSKVCQVSVLIQGDKVADEKICHSKICPEINRQFAHEICFKIGQSLDKSWKYETKPGQQQDKDILETSPRHILDKLQKWTKFGQNPDIVQNMSGPTRAWSTVFCSAAAPPLTHSSSQEEKS